jgi:regulator of protease activity HflC (stomatin/prohibitin superfamily)
MLQPIIDLLTSWWEWLVPFVVIEQYEEAIVLRLGNWNRTITSKNGVLDSGFHFIWPFGIENYLTQSIVVTTMDIDSQSLTTKDGKSIVVSSVVKYRVDDIKKFLLEISDQVSAISDITMSKIKQVITQTNWSEIDNSTDLKIAELIRSSISQYGIKIEPKGVVLKDLQVCRSIRLLQDQQPMININE